MTIKCDYCGKFTSSPHTIQPQTPINHLEPLDPINLCNTCHDKDQHNQWVDSLIQDVDFQPLKDFLSQLKE